MQQTKMSIIIDDTEIPVNSENFRKITRSVILTLFNKAILHNPPMQAYNLVANETGYSPEYIRLAIANTVNKRVN